MKDKPDMKSGIRKRGKSSYEITISLGKDATTGKYQYHWENVKGTKKDAEKRRNELLHQLNTGAFIKPGKTTVAEYLTRWLTDYVKPNLSPRGYERYESIVRVHLIPGIGHIALTQLKPEHLQRHYTIKLNEGSRPLTVRYHHTVIHKALQTAIKWGLVNRNAADGVDVPKNGRKEMQVWNDDEVRQFLDTAKDSIYFALFHTALYTGMRRNELLGLRWSDIDFLFRQLSVHRSLHHLKDGSYVFTAPKSEKSERALALSEAAIDVLKEHLAIQKTIGEAIGKPRTNDDLVFCQPDGSPLRPATITRVWSILVTKASVKPIRLHDARHTHASLMLKAGVHPKIVQERLGHASIQITLDTYSHVMPGIQEAAAEQFDKLVGARYSNGLEPSAKIIGKLLANRDYVNN